ncbi:MAG: hypothetical protein F4246_02975 [Rhodothermaceae bacterium]|nr:hypothetical protein [Rhodothermaceae bacterium]MXX57669.1 hypothetical protein [Rhodothermaceae bacterium]MYD20473.1 hypothetical protein [Rhodothermaceae bacterium]MYD55960.1 hypothetical protein [Rhodothermaceae bacterium]MYI42673.1 hypothetical protein [Rhodothermaceae bacterium]
MKPVIRNYKSDWYSARNEDRQSPPPNHDTARLELLAPLVKQSVELALELEAEIKAPSSIMWEPNLENNAFFREYSIDYARAWCFSYLYGTVVDLANAILRLVEGSYLNASFALLRSAMEAFATCYHISERLERQQTICHDYIAYSFLMAEYTTKVKDAELRRRHKMNPLYFSNKEEVEARKRSVRKRFKAFPNPFAWMDPNSGHNMDMNAPAIIGAADKKYAKLYHLGNLEVHRNYVGTKHYVLVSSNTPLRPIPIVTCGEGHFFKNYKELEFDFLAAELVIRTTELAPSILPLTNSFALRATKLAYSGKRKLKKLVES